MLASATLLALAALASADGGPAAIPKLSADYNAKLFPEHLAFIAAQDASPAPVPGNNASLGDGVSPAGYAPRLFERAFAAHFDSSESQRDVLRRAAEALRLLEKRSGCPAGMNSCASVGSPNKCCQDGTYCTDVSDTMVGHVACCPEGSTCDGAVSQCPSTAVSCPPSLGGGCCLEGYECAGVGCWATVTSYVSTTTTSTRRTSTEATTTTTSEAESSSSEVESTTAEPTTTVAGGMPFRPTNTESITSSADTQTGCPTGFYGCLATHGGGCCRTNRDCETFSCPAPSSTSTITGGGATVVVPGNNLPTAETTGTCSSGWNLCGSNAGPTAGCCPEGYICGTASCFSSSASQTEAVQKEFPGGAASAGLAGGSRVLGAAVAAVALAFVAL